MTFRNEWGLVVVVLFRCFLLVLFDSFFLSYLLISRSHAAKLDPPACPPPNISVHILLIRPLCLPCLAERGLLSGRTDGSPDCCRDRRRDNSPLAVPHSSDPWGRWRAERAEDQVCPVRLV